MRFSKLVLCIGLLASFHPINAQIGIGTNNPNSSAMLQVESTNKGVLFPRMTTLQRTAIPPVNGLIVFDTDSSTLYIYQALAGWKQIKALGSLSDLVTGNAVGDVLVWNGSQWVITPASNLFSFFYLDKDGDGLGDRYITVMAYTAPPGYVANNTDCDDNNPAVSIGIWYRDADGDGYGNIAITLSGCTQPAGYVGNGNDCDDNNPAITAPRTWYADADGDGYGNSSVSTTACAQPPGYVANGNDCNDNNPAVNPGVAEIPANGIDDDCDGFIDESTALDLPDDNFQDSNADGIDGTESAAIFVSSNGNDANPGTKTLPKRLINAGISAALASGKTQVYVGDGTYPEKVILQNGISIYGGYSSVNWSRSASNIATIQGVVANGRIVGIEANNITSSTTTDRLTVLTPSAVSTGLSNYGFYCNNCGGVILKNSNIQSGNAGNGTAGSAGADGAAGTNGAPGQGGSCDNGNGVGGPGGTSPCGRTGGAGGAGGPEGTNSGQVGGAGIGGTAGGFGGAGCSSGCFGGCSGSPGVNGSPAAIVGAAANGAGGNGGTISGGFWFSDAGSLGANGVHGNGGGGGGGGGGQGGCAVNDGGGNGGGGGGAGGCGGTAGTGGSAGGGSFGIFLVNSTGIQLLNNVITCGNGGNGGAGGARGIGGNGGNGGVGASICTGEVGKGGNGSNGAKGGDGGNGGGGAGGPSYGVYRSGTTLTLPGTNTLTAGSGGAGGTSGGNAGIPGNSGIAF